MSINLAWLRDNAISQSYQRGREYKNSVQQLVKQGNVYTAIVHGSSRYKVKIMDEPDDIECSCNCPYDYGGICKHIVAVGLCIIDGSFKAQSMTLPNAPVAPIPQNFFIDRRVPIDKNHFYDKTFLTARASQQEAFLRALFAEDEALCHRFLAFLKPAATTSPVAIQDNSIHLPTKIADYAECSQAIAAIIMDIDTDDFLNEVDEDDYDGYEEYEGDENEPYDTLGLTQKVESLLAPFYQKTCNLVEKGRVLDGFQGLLCLYETGFLVEAADWMDNPNDTYQDMMYQDWKEKAIQWVNTAQSFPAQKIDYQVFVNLIWERYDYFARFNKSNEGTPYLHLVEIQDLIEWATPTLEEKRLFLNRLNEKKLLTANNHALIASLCKALKDNTLLLKCFEKYAANSTVLSMEWLQFLLEIGNRPKWIETAIQLYRANEPKKGLYVTIPANDKLDDYLFQNLELEDNDVFFKVFINGYIRKKQNVAIYEKWKKIASLAESQLLFHEMSTKNPSFYIQLLTLEEKYDDLLRYATSIKGGYSRHFLEATAPILNLKAQEVMDLYKERIIHQMDKGERSRKSYGMYVSELTPILKMEAKRKEVKAFADILKARYIKLPAFLDELKKGGF